MQNIYPIKYAVEPITELAKKGSNVLGFVVSKVYVIVETKSYTPDGIKFQYQVVFPIKGIKSSRAMKNIRIPEYSSYGQCINQEYSTDVYDTYEEAKKVCISKNGKMLYSMTPQQYDMKMDLLQEIENEIMSRTSDMENVLERPKVYKI